MAPDPLSLPTFSHYPALPVPMGVPVVETAAGGCPYLPGRVSVSRGFACNQVPGQAYQRFMDAGFRRSGTVFYQYICPGCRSCIPIRVPVRRFAPSKSQRRTARRNGDLKISVDMPALDAERHDLYARYLAGRHDGQMSDSIEQLRTFLYESPTDTIEFTYRDGQGTLLGVGLCDVTHWSISSVYFYFDPQESQRSLGVFSSLVEIEHARMTRRRWYYLGLYVGGCASMEYKSRFQPCELLGTDGVWRAG